jgi:hypothetical protein
MSSSEKYIESTIVRYARSHGITTIKCGYNGVPDQLFLSSKGNFFIEFKSEIGKLSKLQEHFIKTNQSYIDIYIVKSTIDGKSIINKYIANERSINV